MDDLNRFRTVVLARSWNTCECCGQARSTDAHHRQPRGMGGVRGVAATRANTPSNGLAVCRSCHDGIDDNAPAARTAGWLVPHPFLPGDVPALIWTPQGHGWWLLDDLGDYFSVDPVKAEYLARGMIHNGSV